MNVWQKLFPDLEWEAALSALPDNIAFSEGTSERAKTWAGRTLPRQEFVDRMTGHEEGLKIGSAWTPATFQNERRASANAVKVETVVFDCDRGDSLDDIRTRIEAHGSAAIISSSHSHGTRILRVPSSTWEKWAAENPNGGPEDFMLAEGYCAHVASGARLASKNEKPRTWTVRGSENLSIHHAPCPKFRVIMFPKDFWSAQDYADQKAGEAAYRAGLIGLAHEIGLKIDKSATDLARLFFDPRHPPGVLPESIFVNGAPVDPWSKIGSRNEETGHPAAAGAEDKDERDGAASSSYTGFTASDRINTAALLNIQLWAPIAYPEGRKHATGAWRVTSEALGRAYDEDLSIHPQGIKDHGPENSLSPVGLIRRDFRLVDGELERVEVEDWEAESRHPRGMSAEEAAQWLAECLGMDFDVERQADIDGWFEELDEEDGPTETQDKNFDKDTSAKAEGEPKGDQKAKQKERETLRIQPAAYECVDPIKIPRREWLYGASFIRRNLTVLIASGGVGKSALAVAECLAMVTGKSLLKDEGPREGPLRTWYINLEEAKDELDRRFAAGRLHYRIEKKDLGERLFVNGRELEIVIAREERQGFALCVPVVEAVIAAIRENAIDVVIVDPFVSSHRVNENDNARIDAVAKTWSKIAEATNCAIGLAHHTRKGGQGQEGYTADDSRGASALVNAARIVRVLSRMSPAMAKKLKLEHPWRYIRVDDGKSNLAPPADRASWRHLAGVRLGNRSAWDKDDDDDVQVIEHWEMPEIKAEVTKADIAAVCAAVRAGEWRKDSRSPAWVGKAIARILDWDIKDPEAREVVKKLIAEWIDDGIFQIVTRQDKSRQDREFIIVSMPAGGETKN